LSTNKHELHPQKLMKRGGRNRIGSHLLFGSCERKGAGGGGESGQKAVIRETGNLDWSCTGKKKTQKLVDWKPWKSNIA